MGMCKKFNATISRLRSLQGAMSVAAFARYIGIPQKTLDSCIKGERKPSVEIVMHVCAKCGCSADWLLGLDASHEVSREVFPIQPTVRPTKIQPAREEASLLNEIAALKRRVAALEKSQTSPAFACG